MSATKKIFIVAAKRTPFGSFGGTLKNMTATDLAVHAAKSALAAGKIDPSIVDTTYLGNVAQTSKDACYAARHMALKSGCNIDTPSLTINRLCGSGFQTVINGAQDILLGEAEVSMCGGTESMSQAPLSAWGQNVRWGTTLGGPPLQLEDTLWSALTDSHANMPMAITAENLSEKCGVSREECDEYAFRSQTKWAEANEAGVFDAELAPIEIKTRKGTQLFDTDEHPRSVALEKMKKLPSIFKKGGVVSAGNASGISDGAGVIILASEDAVAKHNLTPLVELVSWHVSGCEPEIMGIGPVPAIKAALKKADLTLDDMDRIEINEAFAGQYLSCEKELGINRDITNINGGAIALGHPLAASGSRITAHLAHDLHRLDKTYAVGSACIGGGQGIAVVLKKC